MIFTTRRKFYFFIIFLIIVLFFLSNIIFICYVRKRTIQSTFSLRTEPLVLLRLFLCSESSSTVCSANTLPSTQCRDSSYLTHHLKDEVQAILNKVSNKAAFMFIFNAKGDLVLKPNDIEFAMHQSELKRKLFVKLQQIVSKDINYYKSSRKMTLVKNTTAQVWEFRVMTFPPYHWYLVQAMSLTKLGAIEQSLYFRVIIFQLFLLLLALAIATLFIDKFTKPLRLFIQYVNHFLDQKLKLDKNHEKKIKLLAQRHDEVALLAKAFLRLDKQKDEYIRELTENVITNERIESELRIAKKIQLSLLPRKSGLLNNPDFSLYAYLEAAHKIGGDFYNFFFISENHLCFMIGDVSDKGVPAAIFMGVAKTLIETIALYLSSPAEILTALNERLCKNNEFSMFTTVFLGILNVSTGDLRYVNAGNNAPILLRYGKSPEFLQKEPQVVVGVFENAQYQDNILRLNSNDILLMYTDGVTEARNKQGTLYSDERLLGFMRDINIASTRILVRKLITDIKYFTKGEPQSDDIAILALCYQKNITEKGYTWIQLPAKIESIRVFLDFISSALPQGSISQKRLDEVILVIEECLVNVIKHAYIDREEKGIELGYRYLEDKHILSVCIKDQGVPFNPLLIKKTVFKENGDYGYGFLLIEELSDELSYNYQDNKNIFDISFILTK